MIQKLTFFIILLVGMNAPEAKERTIVSIGSSLSYKSLNYGNVITSPALRLSHHLILNRSLYSLNVDLDTSIFMVTKKYKSPKSNISFQHYYTNISFSYQRLLIDDDDFIIGLGYVIGGSMQASNYYIGKQRNASMKISALYSLIFSFIPFPRNRFLTDTNFSIERSFYLNSPIKSEFKLNIGRSF